MYLIRVRTNKRVDAYGKDDYAFVGVRLKNGEYRYVHWRGFTLDMKQPVKLLVEAFTSEGAVPRASKWRLLEPGEHLLGSYQQDFVQTYLPFTVVGPREKMR